MNTTLATHPDFGARTRKMLLAVTAAALALSGLVGFVSPREFFLSWLMAVLWPWSISLGSLTLLLIPILTGGRWSKPVWSRLVLHARLMPVVALLFVPVLLGIPEIYPWSNSDFFAGLELVSHRQWFLQPVFYVARTVLYFIIWFVLIWLVAGTMWRTRQKKISAEEQILIAGGQATAGLGLIAILISVTWAAMDWIMSLDPFFMSTMFGALLGMGALLAALAAAIAGKVFWPLSDDYHTNPKIWNDLGNLLLAFVMLWAYLSLAQFLIMWSGNLPQEAAFYQRRLAGSWSWITPVLATAGFFIPLVCLLSRDFKQDPVKLGSLALFLLLVRLVELSWMVLPGGHLTPPTGLHWSLIPALTAVSGCYLLAMELVIHHDARRSE
ncbi:hypothetical protein FYZ48_25770 [Gimesia chilikensis]|uniref:hypothetical protein n=1 Tax=Gimesia chilikensis TaxID=2605989 RepID=UPI0011EC738F|nr:hypothetical protein [Gimesia chilikensis]KAA0131553.1 hypothetical protein FYZ48_25770 [Gimesia chilikensis]